MGEKELEVIDDHVEHTINSLNSVIEHGGKCASLPKKRYFKPDYYSKYTTACRILRDLARALLPLEGERYNLVRNESCYKDLPKCTKYYEIEEKMGALIKEAYKELDKTGV